MANRFSIECQFFCVQSHKIFCVSRQKIKFIGLATKGATTLQKLGDPNRAKPESKARTTRDFRAKPESRAKPEKKRVEGSGEGAR